MKAETLLTCVIGLFGIANSALAAEIDVHPQLFERFVKPPAPPGFSWRVVNNFRTISSDEEQQRYFSDLTSYYPKAAQNCFGVSLSTHLGCLYKYIKHPEITEPTARNYETHWQTSKAQYEAGWATDTHRTIELNFAGAKGRECRWIFDGKPIDSGMRSGSCHAQVQTELGDHQAELTVGSEVQPGHKIHIADILILAFGDSYGAGEGAPTVLTTGKSPALWMDKRCHNSLYAGFAQSAARMALVHQDESVTFLSYACSGAEIDGNVNDHGGGILTPYWGRETAFQVEHDYKIDKMPVPADTLPLQGPLPAQLDRAREALCAGEFDKSAQHCSVPLVRPDFVLISTGGNEMQFGPVIQALALGPCDADCRQEKIIDPLTEAADGLKDRYLHLGHAINALNPKKRVFLMQYPVPVRNEAGEFCKDNLMSIRPMFFSPALTAVPFVGLGLRNGATEFAYEQIFTRLPQKMRAAANDNGWTYVSGLEAASNTKGYCSRRRWYQNYTTAALSQGVIPEQSIGQGDPVEFVDRNGEKRAVLPFPISSGVMHPNMFGHSLMGDAAFKAMSAAK